ncbi:MAG TPA: IS1595 family transposase [Verrucomicrobiae bacterium]|nr:IS1595 family transposase [Verrucomicrobiae bacterium]
MELDALTIAERIPTEVEAYKFLELLRWGRGDPVCPHCGSSAAHYFLTPKNGGSRKTRTGSLSQRRVWECRDCGQQFSVLTGTVMHGTKIPVRTWVFVIFELCSSKNGVAAREVQRKYHVTAKTAWHLLQRIRDAAKPGQPASLLIGRFVADETWIGARPANRHGHKAGRGGQGRTDKTPAMALVSRETGEVRSRVVVNVCPRTLRRVLVANTDPGATYLHTDSAGPARQLAEGSHGTPPWTTTRASTSVMA